MAVTAPARPANILVVDDEPDLRTLYELTLLREGHSVSAAGSLSEARDLLSRQRFDVLISDMRLPDGLGLELLRELAGNATIGPMLIGMEKPVQIAPMTAIAPDVLTLAVLAAAGVAG